MAIVIKLSYIFIISILFYNSTASYDNYIKPESVEKIKNDMPSYADLVDYLPVLSNMVWYCERNKHILSVNLLHGLFLLNVNLNRFVTDMNIPKELRYALQVLLTRTEKLQTEFNNTNTSRLKKMLAALASNVTSWATRLPKLNFNLLQQTYAYGEYPPWDKYIAAIDDINKGFPDPNQSDKCVGSLIASEENFSEDLGWRCQQPEECYKAVVDGSDFGYWLTHRLILLLIARFSRNCAVLSAHEDLKLRIEFCERAYREAEYIAANGFQIVDLFLEQIALCALDGNAQFLRRSWLARALAFQQPGGCFQVGKLNATDIPDETECNGHTMGVALATFAAAIRLILENLKVV